MSEEVEYREFLELSVAIGFVVINWSQIERQIDNWTMVAFGKCGGKRLRKRADIPKSFTDKKEFLGRCFNSLPELAPFRCEGIRLIHEAYRLSLLRNKLDDLVSVNGVFHFQRLVHGKERHSVESFSFDLADGPGLESSIGQLMHDCGVFSQLLAKRFLK